MHAADLISTRANLTPQREALVELANGRRYTFADLNQRANCAAHFLSHNCGVQKGDRISILAHNSVIYVDLFFAALKIGAIFAPLNWRLVAGELAYIVNDCGPKVLFCGPEFVSLLADMRSEIPGVKQFVSIEQASFDADWIYEDALKMASGAEPPRPALQPEDPACILYTSGTTGRPKGALIPHRQIFWNAVNTVVSWGLRADDVSPIFTPMFHAGGLFVFLTPLFYIGGRIVLARTFDMEASLRALESEKCTVLLGVPTIYQIWLDAPIFKDIDFSHIRWFISGAAPCPLALIKAWRTATGKPFRQGYGLTEVGTNCFTMEDGDPLKRPGTVGKPVFHSEMRVVNDLGKELPAGHTGELIIRGPHVCSGYWQNEEATAATIRNGWFYTGDMARRDEDGFFYIAGRLKDMIISGGENVYAAEVEAVFHEHEAVAEAALIGEPHEKWGEVGLLIAVLKPGKSVSTEALRDFCKSRLAAYKVPKRIIFTDALPHSPYGKVIKAELKARYVKVQRDNGVIVYRD